MPKKGNHMILNKWDIPYSPDRYQTDYFPDVMMAIPVEAVMALRKMLKSQVVISQIGEVNQLSFSKYISETFYDSRYEEDGKIYCRIQIAPAMVTMIKSLAISYLNHRLNTGNKYDENTLLSCALPGIMQIKSEEERNDCFLLLSEFVIQFTAAENYYLGSADTISQVVKDWNNIKVKSDLLSVWERQKREAL